MERSTSAALTALHSAGVVFRHRSVPATAWPVRIVDYSRTSFKVAKTGEAKRGLIRGRSKDCSKTSIKGILDGGGQLRAAPVEHLGMCCARQSAQTRYFVERVLENVQGAGANETRHGGDSRTGLHHAQSRL
jgi:hypothetical protein